MDARTTLARELLLAHVAIHGLGGRGRQFYKETAAASFELADAFLECVTPSVVKGSICPGSEPLVWTDNSAGSRGRADVYEYVIWCAAPNFYEVRTPDGRMQGSFLTLNRAKAVAEDHYAAAERDRRYREARESLTEMLQKDPVKLLWGEAVEPGSWVTTCRTYRVDRRDVTGGTRFYAYGPTGFLSSENSAGDAMAIADAHHARRQRDARDPAFAKAS